MVENVATFAAAWSVAWWAVARPPLMRQTAVGAAATVEVAVDDAEVAAAVVEEAECAG